MQQAQVFSYLATVATGLVEETVGNQRSVLLLQPLVRLPRGEHTTLFLINTHREHLICRTLWNKGTVCWHKSTYLHFKIKPASICREKVVWASRCQPNILGSYVTAPAAFQWSHCDWKRLRLNKNPPNCDLNSVFNTSIFWTFPKCSHDPCLVYWCVTCSIMWMRHLVPLRTELPSLDFQVATVVEGMLQVCTGALQDTGHHCRVTLIHSGFWSVCCFCFLHGRRKLVFGWLSLVLVQPCKTFSL